MYIIEIIFHIVCIVGLGRVLLCYLKEETLYLWKFIRVGYDIKKTPLLYHLHWIMILLSLIFIVYSFFNLIFNWISIWITTTEMNSTISSEKTESSNYSNCPWGKGCEEIKDLFREYRYRNQSSLFNINP